MTIFQGLQQLRRRGLIGEFVSIYEDEGWRLLLLLQILRLTKSSAGWHAIFVASDGGRLCRPLIIVADCKPRFIPEKHVPLPPGSKHSREGECSEMKNVKEPSLESQDAEVKSRWRHEVRGLPEAGRGGVGSSTNCLHVLAEFDLKRWLSQ